MKDNFELDGNGIYTFNNAYWMAVASELAYRNSFQVKIALNLYFGSALDFVIMFNRKDTQGFIAVKDDAIIVSFCGTNSLKDWLTNINCKFYDMGSGSVHLGCKIALDNVWSGVESCINSQLRNKKLYICGHSLGGGLAQYAAFQLADMGYPVEGVYTYGQLRIGNKTFVENYNKILGHKTYRHVNNNDIVPTVPYKFMKYRHAEKLKYFNESGKFFEKLSFGQSLRFWFEGVKGDLFEPGLDRIKDHSINDYQDAIACCGMME
ncbi:lipase family protein [Candidatus Pacearchaeota archaeon]|nr:lipase family protein [Candidatus Pacearchaeota archaeon]